MSRSKTKSVELLKPYPFHVAHCNRSTPRNTAETGNKATRGWERRIGNSSVNGKHNGTYMVNNVQILALKQHQLIIRRYKLLNNQISLWIDKASCIDYTSQVTIRKSCIKATKDQRVEGLYKNRRHYSPKITAIKVTRETLDHSLSSLRI